MNGSRTPSVSRPKSTTLWASTATSPARRAASIWSRAVADERHPMNATKRNDEQNEEEPAAVDEQLQRLVLDEREPQRERLLNVR